jgi:hypothetical protein
VRPENNLGFTVFDDRGPRSRLALHLAFELDGPSGQYWHGSTLETDIGEGLGEGIWDVGRGTDAEMV